MKSFLDTIFFRSNNLDYVSQNIKDLTKNTPANKIFDAINSFSSDSEIRYVGGCVRKIINKEKVDDIDLATNLDPQKVCEALKENKINYYETGIEHGTITAIIDEYKFEITTLREDISTDGRHAKVQFSKDWKEDASRRDFTINSIYSDREGNLFDPFDGRKDLENGLVKFIGNSDIRIKEDYLRILRYLRFFTNYSKHPHNPELIRKLKMNIGGISKLSKERLFDELKKISQSENLEKIEGFDNELANEILSRAKNSMQQQSEEDTKIVNEKIQDEDLKGLSGMTTSMLALLAKDDIVNLNDFADLASYELIDKEEGIFRKLELDEDLVKQMIMDAREKSFS